MSEGDKKLRVCVATTMPGYEHAAALDSVLAQALDVRGAELEFLFCDKGLPVCQLVRTARVTPEEIRDGIRMQFCEKCVRRGDERMGDLGYPIRRMGDYIDAHEREMARKVSETAPYDQIPSFEFENLPVGDHAHAGALRYFARGDLNEEPFGEAVLRRYLEAGILGIFALRRLIAARRYDVIVVNHGIYIPQGMIVEVAHSMGVRVVCYNPAYRKHSFTFSHGHSYHFTMLDEPRGHWTDFELSPRLADETRRYLRSRRFGSNDWIWFHDQPKEDIAPILRELGCDSSKAYVAMLTSVAWDAQLHYRANAFPSMMDWIRQTVEYWRGRDDLQLVIRVHPAEVRGQVPSRQRVVDELARDFPELPANVFVLPPEHQASTYALCENADSVIIYNTKAGVEMSALGVPVIVAGEAWIRGKGFSRDVSSPAQYFELLDTLPVKEAMRPEAQELAMRYAYHFFFRRMIPLPFIHPSPSGKPTFDVDIRNKSELAPGRWAGLDAICEGVLKGTPFVYRAESLADPFPGEAAAAPQEANAN